MNNQTAAFATAWSQLWNGQHVADGTEASSTEPLRLEDTPAYPLARTVQMPEKHAYPTGAISFRMRDLAIHGLEELDAEHCSSEVSGERVRMKVTFDQLTLKGEYSLDAKPDPIVEIDTAGNMLDLPEEARRPAGSDTGTGGTTDPTTEAWLDQARAQVTPLSQTTNGQQLLGLYNQHNETYETVFRTNNALASIWQAGGATKDMAADTSTAVTNSSVVNDSTKLYSNNNTYNGNAFSQQLNVASACIWSDPTFTGENPPDPTSPYYLAAVAALSFGLGVSNQTNNDKTTVTELTSDDVYNHVNTASGSLPPVSQTQVNQVIAMAVGGGGADEPSDLGWIKIDEEDKKRLRYLYEATMKQRAENSAIIGFPLFAGGCRAMLGSVEATLDLLIEETPEGPRARTVATSIDLPAFELDINDDAWHGDAAEIARKRLDRMYFIRSLLHQSIHANLERTLAGAAEKAYTSAMRGN